MSEKEMFPDHWQIIWDDHTDRPEIRDMEGRSIAIISCNYPMGRESLESNANLLSAAPDLLRVAKELLEIVWNQTTKKEKMKEFHTKVISAIKKAEGINY